MVADATPVFITAAVVLLLLAAWAFHVALKPGPKWAQDAPPSPPPAKAEPAPKDESP